MNKLFNQKNRKGFTILELLVVVAIIAILAVIAVPQFMNAIDKARVSAQIADLVSLEKALTMYRIDMSTMPAAEDDLAAALITGTNEDTTWAGPYIDRIPANNKWGGALEYGVIVFSDEDESGAGITTGDVLYLDTNNDDNYVADNDTLIDTAVDLDGAGAGTAIGFKSGLVAGQAVLAIEVTTDQLASLDTAADDGVTTTGNIQAIKETGYAVYIVE